MKLLYCPSCTRVFYVAEDLTYLCGRNHETQVWPDGKARRFVISTRAETNRPPWPVPKVSEERELLAQEYTESFLAPCDHPEDPDYSDVRRHFGFGAPGGRHLTKEQVLQKYSLFVLRPVE